MATRVRLKLLPALALSMACANGSEPNIGADATSGTSATRGTGSATMTTIETTGISDTQGSEDASETAEDSTSRGPTSGDSTTMGNTSTTGTGDESTETGSDTDADTETDTDAGTDTDTDAGTDTGACDLMTPDNTCEMPSTLMAVSGDDGSQVVETGTGATWLLVQVQETNASIFEEDLSYTVALESPAEVDYDLFVYQGPQDGDPDCSVTPIQGVPSGALETVSAGWDDDQGIGGEDDSLWLAIEIVHVTGSDCDAEWTLTVTGGS